MVLGGDCETNYVSGWQWRDSAPPWPMVEFTAGLSFWLEQPMKLEKQVNPVASQTSSVAGLQ